MTETLAVPTPDGRSLEVRVAGPRDGDVLLFHHGTPGSGLQPRAFLEAASERNLRLVSFARPGYASSTRRPGRSVADVVDDAAAVLDHLGVDRCFTIGTSGGGPHALACATRIPDRILGTATVAGVAPFDADGLDFLAGMAQENIDEFGAAVEGTDVLQAFLGREMPALAGVTGSDIVAAFGGLVSPVDQAALSDEFGDVVAGDVRHALSSGLWGWHDDDLAFAAPWGFDPAAIRGHVDVWQGGQDRMVPYAHGEWLATHVHGARAHLFEEHGHLSLQVDGIGAILDALVEPARG
jgi:pimeloyl-ACP methyl ester carboxylesterase